MNNLLNNGIIRILLVLLLFIIFLVVFNFLRSQQNNDSGDVAPANPTVYESGVQVQLLCNNQCQGQGQCGELANSDVVILTNQAEPATQNHSLTIPDTNIVTVRARREMPTVGIFDGRREMTQFYQVDWGGLSTWVAGWCIAQ